MIDRTPERVALYARVAAGMQAGDGSSIAAQLAEMHEYAAQRGWSIAGEFVDVGVSGITLDRPGLEDLLAAAEEHDFDVVLVHKLAVFSRSAFDTLAIFESLGRCGVGFASVEEPQFDLSDPDTRLLLTAITDINQYYLDLSRAYVEESKPQQVRPDLYRGLVAPYGYRHSGDPEGLPVVVEKEAEAVRMAFERYATGKYSYQEIADMLDEAGFRPRRGRRFTKSRVGSMLRDVFYTGKVVYTASLPSPTEKRRRDEGEVYPGRHEPIISEELWNVALRVREQRHHVSRTPLHRPQPYLLSRIARCHVCGRQLRTQSLPGGDRYREVHDALAHDDCPNGRISARAGTLHRQIGAIVREIRLPPDWQEELVQIIEEESRSETLRSHRARLIASRRRLKEAYIRGDFEEDEDAYHRELERINQDLNQLLSEDDFFHIRQAAQMLDSLADVWDDADPADQYDLVQLMLRGAQVDLAQDRLLFLSPAALFIPLFRSIPVLQERDPGIFTPIWPIEMADLLPYPTLPPATALPEEPADLPFLPVWPWTPDRPTRTSPALDAALKARRKEGHEGGTALVVTQPGVPPVLLDARGWPEISLEELPLSEVLDRPEGSVAFLNTSLAVQRYPAPGELVQAVFRLLEQEGYWHLVDLLPGAVPAHWVFTFFPEAWSYAQSAFWKAYDFYNVLRQAGFQVKQREHTFYQPAPLGTALEIVRRRPGLLADLPDRLYQERMRRLEKTVEEQGSDTLVPSEVTVVEVKALKGEGKL